MTSLERAKPFPQFIFMIGILVIISYDWRGSCCLCREWLHDDYREPLP